MISIDPKTPITGSADALKLTFARAASEIAANRLAMELEDRLAEIERQRVAGEISNEKAQRLRQSVARRKWRHTPEGRQVLKAKKRRYRERRRDVVRRGAAARRNVARGLPRDFVRWTHLRLEPSVAELKRSTRGQTAEARRMLRQSKKRARLAGIEFSLTPLDVVVPTHCPVFGTPLSRTPGRCTPDTPSIDRVDNSKGYVPGNVCVISHRANSIKGAASREELLAVLRYIDERL